LNNWGFNSQLPHSVVVSVSDIDTRQPPAGVSFWYNNVQYVPFLGPSKWSQGGGDLWMSKNEGDVVLAMGFEC
jgi:hypothetical protein